MRLALYRECRPARFAEIVGQDHVTRTLQNAVAQMRLAHAYLFCGPRGTGKTTTARVLAKALNCPQVKDGEPCGGCEICMGIAGGDGVDVVEMDAASNRGIDEIRNLRERVRLAPVGGRYKVYVIDEVHMLTTEAFNALLKTIEEPPGNVVFILCTTEVYRVPATIISRCQRFDFHPIGTRLIADYLLRLVHERGLDVEPAAARFIARVSTGSLRDALSIVDQCLAYAPEGVTLDGARNVVGALDGHVLVQMAEALTSGDAAVAWGSLERLLAEGRDPREVARGLAAHLRDLLLYRLAGRSPELIGPGADDPAALERQAAAVSEGFLYEAIDALSTVESEMRYAPQPRLALEARLLRLCGASGPQGGKRAGPSASTTDRTVAAAALPSPGKPTPEATSVPKTQVQGAPPAQEQAGRSAPPQPAQPADPDTGAVWSQVLGQLPIPVAGLLHGSSLAWEDGRAWIMVPGDREALVQHLNSGGHVRTVAGVLCRHLGRRVQVGIRLQTVAGGLFGDRGGQPDRPGPASTRAGDSPSRQPGRKAKETGAGTGSLSRQAETMFGAQEVDKGDEQGDEPR